MMREFKYIFQALVAFLLLYGCSREGDFAVDGGDILFRLNSSGVTVTKAEITEGNIANSVVMVYETQNSTSGIYNGSILQPEMQNGVFTGVWKPMAQNSTWTNYEFANMAFHGYAYSPSTALGNGLTINAKGQEIIISQPHTYEPEANIDYLLSKPVLVPTDLARGKVIPLNLEHAMSKVELYVYCADAMVSNSSQTIVIDIQELSISGIYTDVKMVYSPQSSVEMWSRTNYGSPDATYSNNSFSVRAKTGDMSDNMALGFIAVPVDRQDMAAQLNIRYTVKVNSAAPVEFNATFNLADYSPKGWMSNRKIRYELEIDTGINLAGKIVDWVEVDYIEGVVLPEIDSGN